MPAAQAAIARFSPADAEAFPAFEAMLGDIGALVRAIAQEVPPNFGGGWSDLWRLFRQANSFRRLSAERQLQLSKIKALNLSKTLPTKSTK